MTTATLIPATNFEVKNLKGFIIPFKTPLFQGHLVMSGFGIWDKSANAWVSMESTDSLTGMAVPTQYKKSTCELAIKGGLYSGYDLVTNLIKK